jgi:hypothetical protein
MNYLIGVDNSTAKLLGGYARQAYLDGLAMQDVRGYNQPESIRDDRI